MSSWRCDGDPAAKVVRTARVKMENRRLVVRSLDDGGFHIAARGLRYDRTIFRRDMRLTREAAAYLVECIGEMWSDASTGDEESPEAESEEVGDE